MSDGKSGIKYFEKYKSLDWICTCLRFSVIFLSIILAFIPSNAVENKLLFYTKVIGKTLFLTTIGLIFYLKRKTNHE